VRGARTALFAAACLGLATLPTVVHADEPGMTGVAPLRTVRVEVRGSAEEAELLRASLSELFGRINLAFELAVVGDPDAPSEQTPGTQIVVRVDLSEPGGARVALKRADPPTPEEMRFVPQRDSRELLLEETALVVYAGSESLIDETLLAPPNPPPPAKPAPPVPAPSMPLPQSRPAASPAPTRTPWVLEGAVLASAHAYAADAWAVPGLEPAVRRHVGENRWVPGVWLLGGYHIPFRESAQGVELSTSVWSVRLESSVEIARGRSFRLEAGLGGGLDIFVVTPTTTTPGAEPGPQRHDVSGVISSLVAGSIALGRSSRAVLSARLDYEPAPRRYVVEQGGERTTVLEPLAFRPGVSLGLLFDVAGTEARP
jgi:hypothetical protein